MTDPEGVLRDPLRDLRVLEPAGILAGPLVGQFCAELGADVKTGLILRAGCRTLNT